MRYLPFKLPVSGQHGVVDRRTGRYLYGIIADDDATAAQLARLLNQEHRKWSGEQDAEHPPVRLHHDGKAFAVVATGAAANDPSAPEPVAIGWRKPSLGDYVRTSAPECERRLIERLRRQTPGA